MVTFVLSCEVGRCTEACWLYGWSRGEDFVGDPPHVIRCRGTFVSPLQIATTAPLSSQCQRIYFALSLPRSSLMIVVFPRRAETGLEVATRCLYVSVPNSAN